MSEKRSMHNDLSGNVAGHSVQAGAVHGDVVFNSSAVHISPEDAETQRRWSERQQRILDEEDAEYRRVERYVRACRIRSRICLMAMPVGAFVALLSFAQVLPTIYGALGFLCIAASFAGWVQNSLLVVRKWDAGRPIDVPPR
ncbi:hypothetical protein ACIRJS_23140 [Streptomyces sp. NPDC102340]|uniref:hypothetical protein n=1 Tax=unclassified Streptomyces TaxID=2593676 RepID=UPI00380D2F1D